VPEQLNFPPYPLQLRRQEGRLQIFDEVRKKWLVLTPEEWVRQHWVYHLVHEKGFPASLMGIEKSFQLNNLRRRFDILAGHPPLLLVECKAPGIPITQQTFDQASRYNIAWKVPFLAVSNGLDHYICEVFPEEQRLEFRTELPVYPELLP
jgi:hypothetical protein